MIRAARPDDADALFALVQQLGHAIEPQRSAFDAIFASYLAGEEPSVLLLLAEDDAGAVRGYALTTIVPLLATNGLSAQLQEIVVDQDARGLDFGTQLVRAVEQVCVERKVHQLTVASRRAGGFYDRLGYQQNAEYMRRIFD
ncbi:GNAT family N-acetyltransferase [Schumannella soli]|uniref:GNAT family N-acetyltransferase n=1 Tax=Schumannella soli TaxID=2590779 RepID=A0A506Y2V6_9MICO|nr:GNAT family N-acetyltransferase [Schumannella soli]TPW76365.1 GNAT family N-acetyltransferase [Schumannella soli]